VTVVVGLGEVGRPLLEVLKRAHPVEGVDLPARDMTAPVEFLHVCYPAEINDFAGITAGYVGRYRPEIVIIHSTVPVGTTRAVGALVPVPVVHSPVRGKHARMVEELTHYVKFIGTDRLDVGQRVAAHLEAAGMKTKVLSCPEATELAKLTETTYFGLLIAFAQDVDRMARAVGVSYDEVASFYQEIGYLPRVGFFPGIIGGHCVISNIALLKRRYQSELLDAIAWSNELRKAEG
jgi:UDP-N-acetyl-D-mannosaminuronate dehydrogenase